MSENTAKRKPRFTWRERCGEITKVRVAAMEPSAVELYDGEVDSVGVLAGTCGGVESLADGALAAIGRENGVVTERGLARVRSAVKFLAVLLGGGKHREAMDAANLAWGQINSFIIVSPEFEKMYQVAKGGMKRAMGAAVLDTAYELATEGEPVYNKMGDQVGTKKSEKMLDRLLVLSGKEFQKDAGGVSVGGNSGGGITLNFHFDGKGKPAAEVVDVR